MNDFPWSLLDQTARTFSLSLRLLPAPVRGPMALAYLLARLSDTEADGARTAGERRLLERRDGLLELLRRSPEREEIEAVWGTICQGQAWDGRRFPPGAAPLESSELEEYTYLVAGCVGEFWTRLCQKNIPNWSGLGFEEMLRLGREFGCGLQLVNILRDREEDARRGRVYVGEERVSEVTRQALRLLDSGRTYARAVRGRRLRAAVALPWRLGMETLARMQSGSGRARVKVPRSRVYYHAVMALLAGV